LIPNPAATPPATRALQGHRRGGPRQAAHRSREERRSHLRRWDNLENNHWDSMEQIAEVGLCLLLKLFDFYSPPGPTTQSQSNGDFLAFGENRRIGGLAGGAWSLRVVTLASEGDFRTFVSGLKIPFPGNRDRAKRRLVRVRVRRYCWERPRIWCCSDHSAGKSARRVTPMP
jgi:hypothetical protein